VLGDTPLAWRLGSLVFGSLAILGMFALVRAAGGSAWLGVGVAGLMAADNLLLVHGRIGTLDIYVLTLMIWAVVLYLRGHYLGAGALLGVATCIKLVAPYLLIVIALVEVLRRLGASRSVAEREAMPTPGRQLRGYLSFVGVGAVVYLGLLTVMDQLVPPYDMLTAATYRGPFEHTVHMVRFAASLNDPGGAHGIASYPWQWLADYKPIVYFNVDVTRVVNGQNVLDSTTHFLGVVNPMILLFAIPAFALAALRIWRRGHDLDIVAVAWSAGTFLPFVLQSAIGHRISYLYYMVIIVPGIYIMVARLFASRRMRPWATALWACLVVAATVLMYPFLTLPDPNWVWAAWSGWAPSRRSRELRPGRFDGAAWHLGSPSHPSCGGRFSSSPAFASASAWSPGSR
jgi:dolichyl-phosphate-mannose-protein mannosyltransferase